MTYLSGAGYMQAPMGVPRYSPRSLDAGIEETVLYHSTSQPTQVYASSLEIEIEKEANTWEPRRAEGEGDTYLIASSPRENGNEYFCNRLTSTYSFSPKPFLDPHRRMTQFVGDSSDIEHYVRSAFRATTGNELPDDIAIRVCSPFELKRIHSQFNGKWNPGIQGFAVNRRDQGQSEIFVKENFLDALLLTIGHEIGHVMSEPLPNPRDEEAKAFAFEMAWMRALHDENIADLRGSFVLDRRPANNGLHDVAFGFIAELLEKGSEALDIFYSLVRGTLSLEQRLDVLVA